MARYLPVEDFITEQISLLPIDTRKRFAQLISGTAEAELRNAIEKHDRALVQRIADKYWVDFALSNDITSRNYSSYQIAFEWHISCSHYQKAQENTGSNI